MFAPYDAAVSLTCNLQFPTCNFFQFPPRMMSPTLTSNGTRTEKRIIG